MGFSDRRLMIRALKALTQAAFPAFWTKKAHRMFGGPCHLVFFDENNVCAAVVEDSDGSRTADFYADTEVTSLLVRTTTRVCGMVTA